MCLLLGYTYAVPNEMHGEMPIVSNYVISKPISQSFASLEEKRTEMYSLLQKELYLAVSLINKPDVS